MNSFLRFLAWMGLLAALVIGILRAVAIRWVWLPTDDPVFETSVIPSLWGGDLILLHRLMTPAFGDLVLCPEPDHPERYVIGRVLGEAGDHVELKQGNIFVNRKTFQEERTCDPPVVYYPNPSNEAEEIEHQCRWESISGHLHMVAPARGHTVPHVDIQYDVPQDKYFLLSDNRVYPYDSRNFGLVDTETCKEIVFGRIVSRDGWMDSENRLDYIP